MCLAVRKYVKHQYPVNAVSNCIQLLPFQHSIIFGAKVGTYVISTCGFTHHFGLNRWIFLRRHGVSFIVVCVSIGFNCYVVMVYLYLSPVLTMSSLFSILSTAFPDENN